MPKLAEERAQERIGVVEEAALALFKKKGFHGVGLREIAEEAGVSLGNIYNYYESKEEIFESVLVRLRDDFAAGGQPLAAYFEKNSFPEDLEALGRAIGEMVKAHSDYLTLIYVDIAEFSGRHVRSFYQQLRSFFEAGLKERFDVLRRERSLPEGMDPASLFTMIYMQFANYFIVERIIGAKGHLGTDDAGALRMMAHVFSEGLHGTGKK